MRKEGEVKALLKAIVVAVVCIAQGCAAMRPLDVPMDEESVAERLGPGDVVEIVTTSGEEYRFEVEAVREGRIEGRERAVAIREVSELSVREGDAAQTVGVVAVAVLLVAGAVALFNGARDLFLGLLGIE